MTELEELISEQRSTLRGSLSLTGADLAGLATYLSRTQTRELTVQLIQAGAPVLRGVCRGSEAIAALRTWWGKLDPWESREIFSADRFNVGQAYTVLHTAPYKDHPGSESAQAKTLEYREHFRSPSSSPIVTLIDVGFDIFLADGNHTAVASFMHAREQQTTYELPIFYIDASLLSNAGQQAVRDALPEIYRP